MRPRLLGLVLGALSLAWWACAGGSPDPAEEEPVDYRAALRSVLGALSEQAGEPWLRRHFDAVAQVATVGDQGRRMDDVAIEELWRSFTDLSTPYSPRLPESYLSRRRPLIVSWTSPTDGQVSFAWLTLPARWDPVAEYPLYVQLHGFWDVAADRLPYLAYPFSHPGGSFAFEDGYLVSPWGRGNQWYRGIAETDIWEGISVVKGLVRVDERRQFLCGHSMGGYGTWHIALASADTWAALGIHAGALQYDAREVDASAAATLRDLPTYFVVGTSDNLLFVNQRAHGLLQNAGNPNLAFVTFPGGHEYRDTDVEGMYAWLRQFERSDRK